MYEDGTSQGFSLGLVRAERPGIGFDVNLFWVEQGNLKNWLESDTSHGNPGWYSPPALHSNGPHADRRGSSNSAHRHVAVDWALESLHAPGELLARGPTPKSLCIAVACAAIDSWRASLPAPPEEQDSLTSTEPGHGEPSRRKLGSIRRVHAGADASAPPAPAAIVRRTHAPRTHHTPRFCFTRWSISSSSISRGAWTGRAWRVLSGTAVAIPIGRT